MLGALLQKSRTHRTGAGMSGARRLAVALTLAAAALPFATAPAAALSDITPPAYYTCGNAKIAISPPRAWASGRTPEVVLWQNTVQRWNARKQTWYDYAVYSNLATFNRFGQNVTGWSVAPNTTGGRYVNSKLRLPVYHRGYYRVIAFVGNGTMYTVRPVGGWSNYCWMP